jgi:predicted ATPase
VLHGQDTGSAPVEGADSAVAAAERLLDLVDQLCVESPALLIIDDLHWADTTTLSVWRRLAGSTAQRPLLLIGGMRQSPRHTDLAALHRVVDQESLLQLRPLYAAAVTDLVTELAGGRPGPGLTRLAEGAAGNPLFVTELISALDRGHSLQVADGVADTTDPAPSVA